MRALSLVGLKAFGAMALFSSPGFAEQPMGTARSDCEPLYTIQSRDCTVFHVYRCDAPDGLLWRVEEFNGHESELSFEVVEPEGNILWSESDKNGVMLSDVLAERDSFSISSALTEGSDNFDVSIALNIPLFVDPTPSNWAGSLRRDGPAIEVDGLTFWPLLKDVELTINAAKITASAEWYVEDEHKFFVYGEIQFDFPGDNEIEGGPPAQVIRPGEPGFLANSPLYDCGAISLNDDPAGPKKG